MSDVIETITVMGRVVWHTEYHPTILAMGVDGVFTGDTGVPRKGPYPAEWGPGGPISWNLRPVARSFLHGLGGTMKMAIVIVDEPDHLHDIVSDLIPAWLGIEVPEIKPASQAAA